MRRLLRRSSWLALLVVIACALPWPAQANQAKEAKLSVSATIDANRQVSGSGKLTTNNNKPIAGAQIGIKLDCYPAMTVSTAADGSYSFTFVIGGNDAGKFQIEAGFSGDGSAGATAATTSVKIAGAEAGKLTLSVDPGETFPGQLVTVKGKLVTDSGKGVGGALITFQAGGQTISDATTATESDGSFSNYLVIPQDAGSNLTITATYAGSTEVGTASAKQAVSVAQDDLEEESESPSPSETESSSEASGSPSTATPEGSSSATPSATVANTGSNTGGFPWLIAGFVAVGLFGVVVTVGLVLRERSATPRRSERSSMLDGFRAAE